MKTMTVREKLYDYIRFAEDRKIKALYTLVEDEIESKGDYWDDPAFIKMLEKRASEYENGKMETYTWEEVKVHQHK